MKTITEILKKKDPQLTKIINKLKESSDLEIIFRAALEPSLAKYCHFANYQNNVLTIIVANPSWATRLRYAIPDVIKQLRIQPEFKDITSIRYTIPVTKMQPATEKNRPVKLSNNNETLWQNTLSELKKKINHRREKR